MEFYVAVIVDTVVDTGDPTIVLVVDQDRHEIAGLLGNEGIEVSVTVVDQLLEKYNFRKRKAVKTLATGESQYRNEQFETIDLL